MIFCKDCDFFGSTHWTTPAKFVDKSESSSVGFGCAYVGGCDICIHPDCFEEHQYVTPVRAGISKVRIAGQAQLNKDNNCSRYQRTTWSEPVTKLLKRLLTLS